MSITNWDRAVLSREFFFYNICSKIIHSFSHGHDWNWKKYCSNQGNVKMCLNMIWTVELSEQKRVSQLIATIGHFRVAFCVCVKTSRAKPFMWKCTRSTSSFSWKSNSFSYEKFFTRTRFETEAQGNLEMAYRLSFSRRELVQYFVYFYPVPSVAQKKKKASEGKIRSRNYLS